MTKAYHEFLHYLEGLGDNGENPLWVNWKRGNGKPVIETTAIINSSLPLEDLELGLSGLAKLALYDESNRTSFSIVDEKGDGFHRAVNFARDGFSNPKLRNKGLVQKTLGGPENVVARVVAKHIAHLLGDANAAEQLVRIDKKSVFIADRFELELRPGRDIHGELRFKK